METLVISSGEETYGDKIRNYKNKFPIALDANMFTKQGNQQFSPHAANANMRLLSY
jgi:hypothetical protein